MKKLLFILLPVILLAVGAALVMMGVVKIPGLNLGPQKKAAQLYAGDKDPKTGAPKTDPAKTDAKTDAGTPKTDPTKADPTKVATNKPPAQKPTDPAFDTKPDQGAKKLAKLWNEMEPTALKDITKDWKEKDLAAVLNKMDNGKVAEFLGILDAKRASNLSRELQKQASLVPHETGS